MGWMIRRRPQAFFVGKGWWFRVPPPRRERVGKERDRVYSFMIMMVIPFSIDNIGKPAPAPAPLRGDRERYHSCLQRLRVRARVRLQNRV